MLNYSANSVSGYNLTRSLRIRRSASAYIQRTGSHSTQTYTYSFWMKKSPSNVSAEYIFGYYNGAGYSAGFRLTSDQLEWYSYALAMNAQVLTTQVFRDPSAWYHIVGVMDTTNATASERIRLYVNGVRVTAATFTYPSQNFNTYMGNNLAWAWGISGGSTSGSTYYDGYLTEINVIDGQALNASYFGETSSTTGVWIPKKYAGTYGTGGYYLPFTDNSSLTSGSNVGLGKDFSGNGNFWNTNNISVTAGTTYDSMTDVPTLTSTTAANYAVLNPLDKNVNLTIQNGNLTAYTPTQANYGVRGSMGVNSGKWYYEVTAGTTSAGTVGIATSAWSLAYVGSDGGVGNTGYQTNGYMYTNGSNVQIIATWTTGDIIGVAYDVTAGSLQFYKNGTAVGTAVTGFAGLTIFPAVCSQNATLNANFGQRPFAYTPPTGYVALNTYNLPTPTILQGNKYMDATLWTGNSAAGTNIVNQAQFKPDFVWIKVRTDVNFHDLFDTVRGAGSFLRSNVTNAEVTNTNTLSAFNSNGFTVGTDSEVNASPYNYVGWQWQAGQGSTSSNTNGSISSTTSVSTTAGFSIVTYTGTGSAATIGHGLGIAPSFIITKKRSATANWGVYHKSIGATGALFLDLTNTVNTNIGFWNNTSPTSTVFSVNGNDVCDASGQTYVAYCWAEISGFSKFGSYTGNGSTDGTFIYTGFFPKFIIIKSSSNAYNWQTYDLARGLYNANRPVLYPNLNNTEYSVSTNDIDFVSNGFKLRGSDAGINGNGATYIYMAFATNPFKNSNAF